MKLILSTFLMLSVMSCSSVYYSAMEVVGQHKRDIFVSRVLKAKSSQEEAKEQFKDALERFQSVVAVDGGELQEKYDELNAEFEDAKGSAKTVRSRIASIDDVAEALFEEWEDEIELYSDGSLKRLSEAKLRKMRRDYSSLKKAMDRAADSMDPVLSSFQDQVLFLKHNLNARAIAGIREETTRIESDVKSLVEEMELSIKKAEVFIDNLKE